MKANQPIAIPTKSAKPAALLSHVPTEREVIIRLRRSKEPADKLEADERQAAWSAWVEDTRQRGVIEPVKVVTGKSGPEIVDGRNRHAAALEAGLETIPAVEVEQAEVAGLVLATLAHRKGQTKEGLAYLALTLHPRLASGKPGRKAQSPGERGISTLMELAASLGVGMTTMEEAAQTFRHFEGHPAERKKLEGMVIAGLVSLGAARAGAAGAAATGGQPRRPSTFASATRTARSLTSQLRGLEAWAADDVDAARSALRHTFAVLPPAARDLLVECLTTPAPEPDTAAAE